MRPARTQAPVAVKEGQEEEEGEEELVVPRTGEWWKEV